MPLTNATTLNEERQDREHLKGLMEGWESTMASDSTAVASYDRLVEAGYATVKVLEDGRLRKYAPK